MKLVIYDNETENILRLRLMEKDGGVALTAVTEDGMWEQDLLKIDDGGRVHHYILSTAFVRKYNLATEHDRLKIEK